MNQHNVPAVPAPPQVSPSPPVSNRFRAWAARNIQQISFLGAYFLTVVLGNLIYATPWGLSTLAESGTSVEILREATTFSFGYWLLLLLPFVVTPAVALATRKLAGPLVRAIGLRLPEFGRIDYLAVTAICYGVVTWAFIRADAFTLSTSGLSPSASVEARFTILGRLGFFNIVVLQSILVFLALYAVIRAIRERKLFWTAVALANIPAMSLFLLTLNMKWPIVVFYLGVVVAVFVFARQHPVFKAALGAIAVLGLYLVVTTLVFRASPATSDNVPLTSSPAPSVTQEEALPPSAAADPLAGAGRIVGTSIRLAPIYIVHALNRMALIFPHYYNVFTVEGAVCGGVIEQARRNVSCRPSWLIYTRIFGDDGFGNRGTAPAAVHISGYALGGWPVAAVALCLASIILGLFSALPLQASATSGTLAVVGAIAGYHFSQLPGEGPIFYDHGFIWVLLGLAGYAALRFAVRRLIRPRAG